ncbi:TetR/AcrR family transcriptional regulator [Parabacteroides sp. PF5-9]|uniref:TetR/AcrR family transcriptional regulator n=1 Tax=Parabacteroides sp. PF5-9 TaxID=1742404 RepID=UPI0024747F6E|nr:TetR/AcrR family transcriptional regulator [Parabacteroides sp. PF5-9]
MVKTQIIIMALDLFSQYGIKSVSMDDIARNMGISKRTLYSFFDDKETLLVESLLYLNQQLKQYFKELKKGTYTAVDIIILFHQKAMERPRWYSRKFYEDLKRYPKAVEMKNGEKEEFTEVCISLFDKGVKEGVFQKEVNFEIMALLAKEQFKMLHPSKSFSKHSNTDVYNTVLFTFLRGICTDKGRVILDSWIRKKQLNIIQN